VSFYKQWVTNKSFVCKHKCVGTAYSSTDQYLHLASYGRLIVDIARCVSCTADATQSCSVHLPATTPSHRAAGRPGKVRVHDIPFPVRRHVNALLQARRTVYYFNPAKHTDRIVQTWWRRTNLLSAGQTTDHWRRLSGIGYYLGRTSRCYSTV